MSRVAFHPVPAWKRFGATSYSATTKRWAVSSGIWGAGAGAAVLLFLSVTPIVRNNVLVKVPVLGSYWEDHTPASDKPF